MQHDCGRCKEMSGLSAPLPFDPASPPPSPVPHRIANTSSLHPQPHLPPKPVWALVLNAETGEELESGLTVGNHVNPLWKGEGREAFGISEFQNFI